MDPLSISVSIIAIVSATISTIKAVRTVYRAPEELESLLNDLTDTEFMLRDVQSFLQGSDVLLADPQRIVLQERLTEAEAVTLQFKTVLDDLVGPTTSTANRRYKWLKAKRRTRKLSRKLILIHEDLPKRVDQLGKYGLKLELQSLSLAQSQMNSTLSAILDPENRAESSISRVLSLPPTRQLQEATLESIEELRHNTSTLLKILDTTRDEYEDHVIAPPVQSSSRSAITEIGDSTISRSTHPSLVVQSRYQASGFCSESCSCSCHSKRMVASPSLLTAILGQLFIGYRGIPHVAHPCNNSKCKKSSQPEIYAAYYFPQWWAINRIMILIAKYTTMGGPEIALKFPTRVHFLSPAFTAIARQDIEIIKRMFRNGEASPRDIRDWGNSSTLLEEALIMGDSFIFQFLLQAGADPEVEDSHGRSLTEKACVAMFSGKLPNAFAKIITEQLLPKFLDYVQFPSLHKTILGLRASTIQFEAKRLIVSSETINDLDVLGYTALAWASFRGDLILVKQLIEHGADPNVESPTKVAPLIESLSSGAVDCALYFLKHGANPHGVDRRGRSTIFLACLSSNNTFSIPVFEELLRLGVDINRKDVYNLDPLCVTIWNNNCEATRWLLKHGLDYKKDIHHTYLHILAWWGNLALVTAIRKACWSGIDIHAVVTVGSHGFTAMETLLHSERPVKASPELINSFTQLLAEIDERTNNKQNDIKQEIDRTYDILPNEEDDEIFHDCVETKD